MCWFDCDRIERNWSQSPISTFCTSESPQERSHVSYNFPFSAAQNLRNLHSSISHPRQLLVAFLNCTRSHNHSPSYFQSVHSDTMNSKQEHYVRFYCARQECEWFASIENKEVGTDSIEKSVLDEKKFVWPEIESFKRLRYKCQDKSFTNSAYSLAYVCVFR